MKLNFDPGAPKTRMPRYNKVNLRNTGQMTIEDAPPFSVTMIFQAYGFFPKMALPDVPKLFFLLLLDFFPKMTLAQFPVFVFSKIHG